MKRHLHALAAVALTGIISGSPARLAAQTVSKPAVTVVAFTAERGTKLSAEQGAAIADELARQLVEGQRFRVLQRGWLPVREAKGWPSAGDLRTAAASADVEYLVIGTVGRSERRSTREARPATGSQPPFGVPFGGPGFRPMPLRLPPPARRVRQSMVTLSIEVVDVMSGEVVTHARAGYLTAIHQRASRALDQGLQKSIEDIAGTLSFSAATLARN